MEGPRWIVTGQRVSAVLGTVGSDLMLKAELEDVKPVAAKVRGPSGGSHGLGVTVTGEIGSSPGDVVANLTTLLVANFTLRSAKGCW